MPQGVKKQHRISQDTGTKEKHCGKCDTWKPLEAYNKHKKAWDNLRSCCRTCDNAKSKEFYRKQMQTKEGRERRRAQTRRADKKFRMTAKRRAYKRAYKRERRKNDPVWRLQCNISSSICIGLKAQGIKKKPGRTIEFLGCSYAYLMDYLESLFEPGMTRENYGSVWHVDHIVPRAAFGGTREELMIVNWYKNLQPMFTTENLKKGAKFEDEDKVALIERSHCRR